MLVNERPEASRNPPFDCEASLREARSRKPLKTLMVEYGHDPKNGKWKTMTCPFCHHKDCAGVVQENGQDFFKCFHADCATGGKGLDEVGYIAQESGLNRKEAFTTYLKMTDVWKDRTKLKSPEPERSAPKPDPITGFTPDEMREALESGSSEPSDAAPSSSSDESDKPPFEDGDETPAPASEEGDKKKQETTPEQQEDQMPGVKKVSDELRDVELGLEALREFYAALKLSPADEELLFRKRGLTSATSVALGYRSNNRTNGAILGGLLGKYPDGALVSSGLFFRDKKSGKLRCSAIYTGMGRVGEEEWEDEDGNKHERIKREYTQPILIPYFNDRGELVHLRPHKDHPKGQPPMLYVSRRIDRERKPEKFERVVLTEGEFKVGGLWQMLGEGRDDGGEPYGIAALPGINMAKNEDVRFELDEWLIQVGAREVFIAYDRQNKAAEVLPSREPNPAYQPDPKKRYDAEIWSRYLAIDLKKKLHLYARVTTLPETWMDEKLKADWDGALAKMIQQGVPTSRKQLADDEGDLAYG